MRHALSVGLSLLILLAGVWMGKTTGEWSYAARSGALIVIVAVLLEAWPLMVIRDPDEMPMWTTRESHRDARVALVLVCLGTLVQGCGDLVAKSLLG